MNYVRYTTLVILLILIFCNSSLRAQDVVESKNIYATLTGALAPARGTISIDGFYTKKLLKKKRIGVGAGVRFTSFIGADLDYITAPAKLTSGSTSPLIFFKENIAENLDTFLIRSPQVNMLNLAINIDYLITSKITVGFNIDVIGFSFGKKVTGHYNYNAGVEDSEVVTEEGRPTSFNILLISDNDRGSLNSEFYGRYKLNEKIGIKAGMQFLFTEYTTKTNVQRFPEENDRFRNKSLLFCAGVSLKI